MRLRDRRPCASGPTVLLPNHSHYVPSARSVRQQVPLCMMVQTDIASSSTRAKFAQPNDDTYTANQMSCGGIQTSNMVLQEANVHFARTKGHCSAPGVRSIQCSLLPHYFLGMTAMTNSTRLAVQDEETTKRTNTKCHRHRYLRHLPGISQMFAQTPTKIPFLALARVAGVPVPSLNRLPTLRLWFLPRLPALRVHTAPRIHCFLRLTLPPLAHNTTYCAAEMLFGGTISNALATFSV